MHHVFVVLKIYSNPFISQMERMFRAIWDEKGGKGKVARKKKKKESEEPEQHVVKRNTCEIINSTQLFRSINKYTICGYEKVFCRSVCQKWIAHTRSLIFFSGPIAFFLLDGPAFTWFSTENLLFVLFPLYDARRTSYIFPPRKLWIASIKKSLII